MKTIIKMGLGLAVVTILLMGCGKSEEPENVEVKENISNESWEPESVDVPAGHSHDDGHDHSGHNH